MSHFDNLVTSIADAFLNPFTDTDATEFPVVDVTDPTHATLEGTFDLTTLARIIITAGWVHVDELDRLRALDGAVEAIRRTSGAVEIAGVRIEPCDEYGATDTTRGCERLRDALDRVREAITLGALNTYANETGLHGSQLVVAAVEEALEGGA